MDTIEQDHENIGVKKLKKMKSNKMVSENNI